MTSAATCSASTCRRQPTDGALVHEYMIRVLRRLAVIAALVPMFLAAPDLTEAQGLGVKGGYLYSSFDFEGVSDVFDRSSGWMAGLFFGGNRDGRVGVMGEINLQARRGGTDMESETIYYAQVPLLLRINAGSRSRGGVSGYGIIGPAVDVNVGSNLDSLGDPDEIESVDASLVVGVGVEITRFIIEGRGTWGLRNIVKGMEGVDIKTKTFALLVGLRFN